MCHSRWGGVQCLVFCHFDTWPIGDRDPTASPAVGGWSASPTDPKLPQIKTLYPVPLSYWCLHTGHGCGGRHWPGGVTKRWAAGVDLYTCCKKPCSPLCSDVIPCCWTGRIGRLHRRWSGGRLICILYMRWDEKDVVKFIVPCGPSDQVAVGLDGCL